MPPCPRGSDRSLLPRQIIQFVDARACMILTTRTKSEINVCVSSCLQSEWVDDRKETPLRAANQWERIAWSWTARLSIRSLHYQICCERLGEEWARLNMAHFPDLQMKKRKRNMFDTHGTVQAQSNQHSTNQLRSMKWRWVSSSISGSESTSMSTPALQPHRSKNVTRFFQPSCPPCRAKPLVTTCKIAPSSVKRGTRVQSSNMNMPWLH